MKKLLVIALLGAFSYSSMEALFGLGRGACCQTQAPCATECAPACKPVCTKEIQVPVTVMKTEVVEVAAIEKRIPQEPVKRCIAQPCRKIVTKQAPLVIPQPDIVTFEAVPDKVEFIAQPDIITYECPAGTCESNRGGAFGLGFLGLGRGCCR